MRKWLFLLIFLAIVFGIFYFITIGYYAEGTRGGTATQLSKRGYLFKSYEGELLLGGMAEGDGALTATRWKFSVSPKSTAVIENINTAIKNGFRISVKYEEKFFILPWNGETKYMVTNAEVIRPARLQQQPLPQQPLPQQVTPQSTVPPPADTNLAPAVVPDTIDSGSI